MKYAYPIYTKKTKSNPDSLFGSLLESLYDEPMQFRHMNPFLSLHSHNYSIKEQEKAYLFTIPVPGVSKDDLDISLENDVLSVSTTEEFEKSQEDEAQKFIYKFSLALPQNADVDSNIEAELAKGILSIYIPKHEASGKKQIEIKEIAS